jgi:hypothetical protein
LYRVFLKATGFLNIFNVVDRGKIAMR